MDLSVKGILKMWCALVAVSLGAGFACVAMSQNPEVGSSYTLKSWQNPARQIRQIIGQFTKAA